jgi:hypothetical protein
MTFDCHWKSIKNWVWMKKFAIPRSYNAKAIYFLNLQKWKKRDSSNTVLTMIHGLALL